MNPKINRKYFKESFVNRKTYLHLGIKIQTQKFMAKKSIRVSWQAAYALGVKVVEQLNAVSNEVRNRDRETYLKSSDYKKLSALNKKAQELTSAARDLRYKHQKQYNVSLDFNSNGTVTCAKHCENYVSDDRVKKIRPSIIAANQLQGIEPDQLVMYITKEELKKKEPTCN